MSNIVLVALIALVLIAVIVLIILVLKNKNGVSSTDTDILAKQFNDFAKNMDSSNALLSQKIEIVNKQTNDSIEKLTQQMTGLTKQNYEQQIKLMQVLQDSTDKQSKIVEQSISKMQDSNEKKLEQMRVTVDEKMTETLNKRINASFEQVSNQLQAVYKSLGEMKELSSGVTSSVTDLNKVLTNVKSRGTWAEVQLGNILDQTIPGMYDTNVKTNPKYNGQVEFAVKIPNTDDDSITWLPVDSKFPMEDYVRLSNASDVGDLDALERAKKALEQRVLAEGKTIKQYISVPDTTPFAILYLATEGLYAEIMRSKNGIAEKLQAEGIMVAGPSTITALLNSLAMGFRSIAINQKANEVWKVLGAAKAQYDKFGDQLKKIRRNLELASNSLDDAYKRNETIQKKLKSVESLDTDTSNNLLELE